MPESATTSDTIDLLARYRQGDEQAATALEQVGVESDVLDLRSLSPWDEHAVIASAQKTARLVVVHEDNYTCGMGAEVLATVAEKARLPVALRRVTRADTFVPCNFGNQLEVLPSFSRVLSTAAEMLALLRERLGHDPAEELAIAAEEQMKITRLRLQKL